MKRFVIAVVLACALSGSAYAGNIPMTGPNDPPPPPGDQQNGGCNNGGDQGAGGLALLILDLLF
jgi:opacity protein-like surface antigen